MNAKIFGTIALVGLLGSGISAFARGGEHRGEKKAAFEACFAELGIAKKERGSELSEEQRTALHACLESKGIRDPEKKFGKRGKHRAEMQACLAKAGIEKPMKRGKKSEMDEATRAIFDSCREQIRSKKS